MYVTGQVETDNAVKVLYCNVRSVANVSKFQLFLLYVKQIKPDIICVTETWFNAGDELFLFYLRIYVIPCLKTKETGSAVRLRFAAA